MSQDLPFEDRMSRLQRVGWVVLLLFLAASLAGLFGSGPLSRAVVRQEGGSLWLEYERFVRGHAPTSLRVHLSEGAAPGGTARVWLSREYVRRMPIERITPEPRSAEVGPDRLTYTFAVTTGPAPTVITFHVQPEPFGLRPGQVGLVEGPAVGFCQVVYP